MEIKIVREQKTVVVEGDITSYVLRPSGGGVLNIFKSKTNRTIILNTCPENTLNSVWIKKEELPSLIDLLNEILYELR